MDNDCKYHPLEPATWHCSHCVLSLCSCCVSAKQARRTEQQLAKCPLCASEVDYLGGVTSVKPFWQCTSQFISYPVAIAPLLFIFMNALAVMMVPKNGLGLGLLFLTVSLSIKYAYTIAQHTLEGELSPPGLNLVFKSLAPEIWLQQIVIVAIPIGLTLAAYHFLPDSLFVVVFGLVVLILPASIIAFVLDRSMAEALKPTRLMEVARGIGWAYGYLYGLILMGILLLLSFVGMFKGQIPESVFELLLGGLSGHYLFFMFYAIGYVMFQYQSGLEYVAEYDAVRKRSTRNARSVDPFSIKVDIFLKEGRYKDVVALLQSEMKRPLCSGEIHDQFHKLMVAMDNQQALLSHADEYLQLQLELGRLPGIDALFQSYTDMESEYKPGEPELCFQLAECFFGMTRYREVFHLLHRLHVRAPEYQQLPDAYLLLARALGEGLNLSDKAQSYLKYILKAYPDTSQAEQAQTYLDSLISS
ncbi:MAG: hypothetical protein KUG82_00415 [Pseudomonadales bacterium]|nr:hypothetical protein [Pseudomonadales bacterium]